MDALFADVSEFQAPVDDSYPYRILSLRSNDGTYQDHNFAQNHRWAAAAADAGKLDCFIVYCYWRPNWEDTAQTLINMVASAGGPHPKMAVMIDLESGGNPGGDQSDPVNRMFWKFSDWLGGNTSRVIGYANGPDFQNMWVTRPAGLRVIGAGYGGNPNLPGQLAHQYTDGTYGADPANGLPSGAAPFGNCDMNSADGMTSVDFAAACGITTTNTGGDLTPQQAQQLSDIWDQVRKGWAQLGTNAQGQPLTIVDGLASVLTRLQAVEAALKVTIPTTPPAPTTPATPAH